MAKGILLEAGTNEMELLVFRLAKVPFGINVAKVREIIQQTETIHIPHSPRAVEGSFRLRDQVLTLVNLGAYFDMEGELTRQGNGMIIVVEFNNITCGVLVEKVDVIYRLSWDQIEAPSQYLMNLNAPITGTAQLDKETVLIADFETIIGDILGIDSAALPESAGEIEKVDRSDVRIILADDSSVLRTSLVKILNQYGYTNLTVCTDGQQAWETIQEKLNEPNGPFDLVLSDIEMPRMDGLHLTSRIKDDPNLKSIPVVLFSSLINEDNVKKCKAVGANAQVSKPDSEEMIKAIGTCLEQIGKTVTDAQPVAAASESG